MKIIYKLSLSVLLCCWHFSAAGQSENYTVYNYNNENGLPQNTAKSAVMDDEGYLWIGTEAGIVRYDGKNLRTFDKGNSPLVRNRLVWLNKDSKGRIYCVDDGGNIVYHDRINGFSKAVPMRHKIPSTSGDPLDLDEIDLGPLEPYLELSQNHNSDDFIFHPTGPGKGFVTVLVKSIVAYVSSGKVQWVNSLDWEYRAYRVGGVTGDKFFYLAKDQKINAIDTNGKRTTRPFTTPLPCDRLKDDGTFVGFFPSKDHLLFKAGAAIYEVKSEDSVTRFDFLLDIGDIPYVHGLSYYPQQRLITIGSATKGLFLFKKQQFASFGCNINVQGGNNFYPIVPYGTDQILSNRGLFPDCRQVPGIHENIRTILHDRNGHYWCQSSLRLIHLDEQLNIIDSFPISGVIDCIREDDEGTLWLITGSRHLMRMRQKKLEHYPLHDSGARGKWIVSFAPAGKGIFWVAGTKLCVRIDVNTGSQQVFHELDSAELRENYIDKKGNLWLGSYGNGYYLYLDGKFVRMPEDNDHHLNTAHTFLEDKNGYIWITTNNGLFQFAVQDLYDYARGKSKDVYHQYYGKESGLRSSEFNGGCSPGGLILGDGRFVFPSIEGLVIFRPDSIQPLLPVSKIYTDNILLDGKQIDIKEFSQLPASFRRLELTISSPYFGNANNQKIEYNIDGLDDHWYAVSENDRIVLNRLKHGDYKLKLRKKAGFGSGNYITTEYSFVVAPFFYQTWWFRIGVAILLAILILLAVRMRYRYLVRQRNRLEAEVKDRTAELVYNNKLKEKLTLMIAHDLQSPLHFLSMVTDDLQENIHRKGLNEISSATNEIRNTTAQVYRFVEEFNLWASSFNEGFAVNTSDFLLDEMLQELRIFFADMANAQGNSLLIDCDPALIIHADRELLKVVVRNIIDNANKYTQKGNISVKAKLSDTENCCITIADTGAGMSEQALQKIQSRIRSVSTAAAIEKNARLGYQIVIDFAHRLNTTLEVESEQGKGTSVKICHIKPAASVMAGSKNAIGSVSNTQ